MEFHLYRSGEKSPTKINLTGSPVEIRLVLIALIQKGFKVGAGAEYIHPPAHLADCQYDPEPVGYAVSIKPVFNSKGNAKIIYRVSKDGRSFETTMLGESVADAMLASGMENYDEI